MLKAHMNNRSSDMQRGQISLGSMITRIGEMAILSGSVISEIRSP